MGNDLLENFIYLPKEALKYLNEAGKDELIALIAAFSKEPSGDIPVFDLSKAVRFWAKRGIILPTPSDKIAVDSPPQYEPEKIAGDVDANGSLKFMLARAQGLLGRTLSSVEINAIYGFYDWLRLPPEVILVLIDHCVSCGKSSIKYIEKVAIEWAKAGIFTFEAAEKHIENKKNLDSFERRIKSLLGITSRDFAPFEKEILKAWEGFSLCDELITLAFDRTVKNTGKLSLPYMNKILESWHAKGYESKKEVEAAERGRSKRGVAEKGRKKTSADDYTSYEDWSKSYIKSKNRGEE